MPEENRIATPEEVHHYSRESEIVATAEDLRKAAEAEAYDPPERLALPKSGFIVLVRRPRPLAYLIGGAPLPQGLAAKLAASEDPENAYLTDEDRRALFERRARVHLSCFIQPKFSLDPADGEANLAWLPEEDRNFLARYLGGEIDADGADLGTFRADPASRPAGAGANGENLEMPTQPTPPR